MYRGVAWQILCVGVISLLAPGLWNGAQSLGAGGALEPYLVRGVDGDSRLRAGRGVTLGRRVTLTSEVSRQVNAGNSIVFSLMGLGAPSSSSRDSNVSP